MNRILALAARLFAFSAQTNRSGGSAIWMNAFSVLATVFVSMCLVPTSSHAELYSYSYVGNGFNQIFDQETHTSTPPTCRAIK